MVVFSEFAPDCGLSRSQERTKIFVPRSVGHLGLRSHPQAQLIQIFDADIAIPRWSRRAAGRRDQVSILGITYSPKMNLPIASPKRFTSPGSDAARN